MGDNNGSFSTGEDDSPFFADITMDLAEAHGIAETPEPTKREVLSADLKAMPQMPSIPDADSPPPVSFQTPPRSNTSSSSNARKRTPSVDAESVGEESPNRQFASITSEAHNDNKAVPRPAQAPRWTPSVRRWPRDVSWAVGFGVIVPASLLLPFLFSSLPTSTPHPTDIWLANIAAPRLATLHTLLWGYVAALIISRLLYRTLGGGDGDDARHLASQMLLLSAPVSITVYILLILAIYFWVPKGLWYAIIPLWFLARDLFLFRSWKITATTPGGRQAFFQALTCMTLDILSRSLRRSSFYRIVSLLLIVQLIVIAWWRMAILAALRSQSLLWIVFALLGGKWATGTVARLLTLISAGGIASWFAEQDALVQGMSKQGSADDEDEIELSDMPQTGTEYAHGLSLIPTEEEDEDGSITEAYRTADASAYRSTLVPDEGMDDDFEDEEAPTPRRNKFLPDASAVQGSNVKQLLFSGLTISFGSVTKCGLLGGLAQFVWSQIRKIDTARATLGNFHGMAVGNRPTEERLFPRLLVMVNRFSRDFVRSNSDMAMSHVAAYQKSYQRAALDVAMLIDESGVEPMIHEDISTHMSACVGGSVSGIVVMFTGLVLVGQRNRSYPNVSDSAILLDMLMAFVFCYTLIFTVMEPLRAAIKAVYVSFAQHPQALSQAFPLIYHRLSRMSQSNLN
eukprot:Nitzschia sp. Nitz4//scaffold198_size39746//1420//3550//NITZ4_007596-RA/size39746-augustus-gene-0.0-mRNA-1//1//CDS//3329540503//5278//frame0